MPDEAGDPAPTEKSAQAGASQQRFDVFISYSTKDKLQADMICGKLEAAGVRCWIAPRDIRPGANWPEAIINAIDRSRVAVLVFSEHANASPDVQREIERALSKQLPLIPFRVQNIPPNQALEYFLGNMHWLDAFDPPLERHFARLVEVVRRVLDGTSDAAPAASIAFPPAAPGRRRSGGRMLALTVLGLVLVGAAVWYAWNANPARRPETHLARQQADSSPGGTADARGEGGLAGGAPLQMDRATPPKATVTGERESNPAVTPANSIAAREEGGKPAAAPNGATEPATEVAAASSSKENDQPRGNEGSASPGQPTASKPPTEEPGPVTPPAAPARVRDGERAPGPAVDAERGRRPPGLTATWANGTQEVRVALQWHLPSRHLLPVSEGEWGRAGTTTAALEDALDGPHHITFVLEGEGASADVQLNLNVPGYAFPIDQRMRAPSRRVIALDVAGGKAKPIFNGWLAAGRDGAGGVTGNYPAEVVCGWRNAVADFDINLQLWQPDGHAAHVYTSDWGQQNVEYIKLGDAALLANGDYRLVVRTAGQGVNADVAFDLRFLNVSYSEERRMPGEAARVMGFAVQDGVATTVFNSWISSGKAGFVRLSESSPLEAVAGWSAGNEDVNVDLAVIRVETGEQIGTPWEGDWALQNYERVSMAPGVELPDGVYRFLFRLSGSGRTAEISYQARLLNWKFEKTKRLMGDIPERAIDVRVTDGRATEIANGWEK